MNKEKMIEAQQKKDIGYGVCKCGNKLTTTTFRDESGEVVGWVVECLSCGQIFSEE
jgi:hypothetical protein